MRLVLVEFIFNFYNFHRISCWSCSRRISKVLFENEIKPVGLKQIFKCKKWQFWTKVHFHITFVFGICSNSCSTLYSINLLLCCHANIPSWINDWCICKHSIICHWNSWKRLQANGGMYDLWYTIIHWLYCNGFQEFCFINTSAMQSNSKLKVLFWKSLSLYKAIQVPIIHQTGEILSLF